MQHAARLQTAYVSFLTPSNSGNIAGETYRIPKINGTASLYPITENQIYPLFELSLNPSVGNPPANRTKGSSLRNLLCIQTNSSAVTEETVTNTSESYIITAVSGDISPAPHLITSEPEMISPGSNVIPPEPEIISPGLDVTAPVPEVTPPGLDVTAPVPEVTPPAPNVIAPVPEVTPPAPNVTAPVPEIISPDPDVIPSEPEIIPPGPAVITPDPEIVSPNPDIITDKDSETVPPEQTLIPDDKEEIPGESDSDSSAIPDTDRNPPEEDMNNSDFICNGFILNSSGMIIGCQEVSITDGVLRLPSSEVCTGVAADALTSINMQVYEIYIPAGIVTIEDGAFDCLTELLYIEVHPNNPVYASNEGLLYKK